MARDLYARLWPDQSDVHLTPPRPFVTPHRDGSVHHSLRWFQGDERLSRRHGGRLGGRRCCGRHLGRCRGRCCGRCRCGRSGRRYNGESGSRSIHQIGGVGHDDGLRQVFPTLAAGHNNDRLEITVAIRRSRADGYFFARDRYPHFWPDQSDVHLTSGRPLGAPHRDDDARRSLRWLQRDGRLSRRHGGRLSGRRRESWRGRRSRGRYKGWRGGREDYAGWRVCRSGGEGGRGLQLLPPQRGDGLSCMLVIFHPDVVLAASQVEVEPLGNGRPVFPVINEPLAVDP